MTEEESFLEYLKNAPISQADKQYASSFFKKKEYIDKLNDTAITAFDGVSLSSGMGNFNSKVAIVIENHVDLGLVKSFAEPIFGYINTSLWNMYITFHKKTDFDSPSIYNEMLKHEMRAVEPSIIIYFSDKETLFEEMFDTGAKQIQVIHVNMDNVKYVLDKDHFKDEKYCEIMENVYNLMVKLIPYREIEILE